MKLNTLLERRGQDTLELEDLTELGGLIYNPFSITFRGTYLEPSTEFHPYGDGTAEEHFAAGFDVDSIVLSTDAEQLGDDDEIVKVYKKGENVKNMEGVDTYTLRWLDEQAQELAQNE